MDSSNSSGQKSAKRVIIRIDPVPNFKTPDSKDSPDYNYEDHARYVTPENEVTAPPAKSALKTKRRQSLMLVSTPPASRHVSITQSPDVGHEAEAVLRPYSDFESVVEEETLPEHHRVLYELLGTDKAESILNPKIEEPAKKPEEKQKQEDVRQLPTVDACLGADALWEILKKESDKKLFKMDKKIPVDWKLSYGAYVRNNISKNRALVERSFTHHADVPELDKLLNQRYKKTACCIAQLLATPVAAEFAGFGSMVRCLGLYKRFKPDTIAANIPQFVQPKTFEDRVLKARHHANVMFRSSENNKNRTTLLLSNNPVPDYNDREGHERLERYFSQQLPSIEPKKIKPPSLQDSVSPMTSRHFPNLHFLTENQARTKGRFYDKYTTADAVKMVTDIPGYRVELPPSMKDRVVVSAPVHDFTALRPMYGHGRLFTPRSPSKRDPTWQPLTVGALMEYSSTKFVVGHGAFRYGQPTRWHTQAPATA